MWATWGMAISSKQSKLSSVNHFCESNYVQMNKEISEKGKLDHISKDRSIVEHSKSPISYIVF